MRESFIFYQSFYEAICELDDKNRLKMYDLIAKFALKNEEPDKISGICKALFALIRPQILANNIKMEQYQRDVENGKKGSIYGKLGGRPKKNNEDKKTPPGFSNHNPPKNPINENVNVNENDNVNVNENDNKKITPLPYGNFQNVYLTEKQKNEFECLVMDKKTADEIINNLSENIACKKEQIFDEQYPDMHLLRLKKYWQFYRTKPKGNNQKDDNYFERVDNIVDRILAKNEQK